MDQSRRAVHVFVIGSLLVALVAVSGCSKPVAGGEPPAAGDPIARDVLPAFVEIPAGPFTMGADAASDPEAFDNERWSPAGGRGRLDVPTFYLARTETTVQQFAAFVRATGHTVDPRSLEAPATHPVTFVSWPEALAYCRWLQRTLQNADAAPPELRALVAQGWRVTLPSEAEWEKAARGTDGRRFPWGDAPRRDRANFESDRVQAAGQFSCPECAHGLADMSGNVWEWTSSPYQPYPHDAADDRANLDVDPLWVMRGGHFGDPARMVRTTARGAAEPGVRRPFIGFRVALTPPAR